MRVIGIDPGLTRTGYAVVESRAGRSVALEFGTLRAPGGQSAAEQLLAIRDGLRRAMLEHRPEAVAVERLFFNSNRRTMLRAAQASGVALLAAAESGLPVCEYTPSEVKLAVTGHGAATKDQVGYMVRTLCGITVRPDSADASDALALALCHLHGARVRSAAEGAR